MDKVDFQVLEDFGGLWIVMDQQRKLAFKFCKMNCGLWIGMDQQRKLVFKFWKIVDWDEKVDFKVLGNEL